MGPADFRNPHEEKSWAKTMSGKWQGWLVGGSFLAGAGLLYLALRSPKKLPAGKPLTPTENKAVETALAHETNPEALKGFSDAMVDSPQAAKALADKAVALGAKPTTGKQLSGGFNFIKTIGGIAKIPGSVVHEVEKFKPAGDIFRDVGHLSQAAAIELAKNPFGKVLENAWASAGAAVLAPVIGPLSLALAASPGLLRGEKFDRAFMDYASWAIKSVSSMVPGAGDAVAQAIGPAMETLGPQLEGMIAQVNPQDIVNQLKTVGFDPSQITKTVNAFKQAGITKVADVNQFAQQIGVPANIVQNVDDKLRAETIGKMDPRAFAAAHGLREDVAQHAFDALMRKGSSFATQAMNSLTMNGVTIPAIPANPGKVFDPATGKQLFTGAPITPPNAVDRKVAAVKSLTYAAQSGNPHAAAALSQIDRQSQRKAWVNHYAGVS